ncbi:MAG: DNA-methyltransferase [Burkholderiaceae bacterium]
MTPYYEAHGITVYLGDSIEVLPTLDAVDAIVTDPPYNVSEEGADIRHLNGDVAQRRDFGGWDRDGWEPSALLALSARLVRPGGALLAFCSDRLLSAYREAADFSPRGTIVWEKLNPPPTPRPSYVSATEWCVWLQRDGGKATWNGSGFTPNILRHPICGGGERSAHPTQKPLSLLLELVQRHTNPDDLILDPFAGSGTTLVAAKQLGRRAIGIELEERWAEVAAKRLESATPPLFTIPSEKTKPATMKMVFEEAEASEQ